MCPTPAPDSTSAAEAATPAASRPAVEVPVVTARSAPAKRPLVAGVGGRLALRAVPGQLRRGARGGHPAGCAHAATAAAAAARPPPSLAAARP